MRTENESTLDIVEKRTWRASLMSEESRMIKRREPAMWLITTASYTEKRETTRTIRREKEVLKNPRGELPELTGSKEPAPHAGGGRQEPGEEGQAHREGGGRRRLRDRVSEVKWPSSNVH